MKVLFLLLFLVILHIGAGEKKAPVNVSVGLIYDSSSESTLLSAMKLAIEDFYDANRNQSTRLELHVRDAKDDVLSAAAAALDLIENVRVQAILGPSTSQQASFVSVLGQQSHVPVITVTATNPSLTSVRNPYFFRATQNDSTQSGALGALMKAFQWREAAVIYDDNDFGKGILSYLSDALLAADARISYNSAIPPNASDEKIKYELSNIRNLETKVIIAHVSPDKISGAKVFTTAKDMGLMTEGHVWFLTDGVMNMLDSSSRNVKESLRGAVGVQPYITNHLDWFYINKRWKNRERPKNSEAMLDVYAVLGYDAVFALATAIEGLGSQNLWNPKSGPVHTMYEVINAVPVSGNGEKLSLKLSTVKVKGLTKNFHFVDGQLPEATYRIVNVGKEDVGYWTRGKGLARELNSVNNGTSPDNLKLITWPGDTTTPPKGWGRPANKPKLRVGFPINGYEFSHLRRTDNKPVGFSIDLFEELLKVLPYYVDPEYIPFDGEYNDLVNAVYTGKLDAAVGDITILANRSYFVDFTSSYMESEVFIVTTSTRKMSKKAWLFFFRPMTKELWITIICSFIGVAVVVWILEHRVNKNFRGPPSNQVGASLLYSFSTMIFAHWESVNNNLTRFVIVVWCFLLLVLIQSYSASLTSFLTVEVAQSNNIDVDTLIRDGRIVGYQKNSFLRGMLLQLGFREDQLKSFDSYKNGTELLDKGKVNSLFIEKPYLRSLFKGQCDSFTAKQSFLTGGFGFAFPHGSPLALDMSRAILQVATNLYNVTKYDTMTLIDQKWFPFPKLCNNDNANLKSTQLELNSFLGLFIAVGAVCFFALSKFALDFYWENRDLIASSAPDDTIKGKIGSLLKIFDSPAHNRYPFRSSLTFSSSSSTSPSTFTPSP